jgi:hypothetical protein
MGCASPILSTESTEIKGSINPTPQTSNTPVEIMAKINKQENFFSCFVNIT